MISKCLE